jgi:hypothetical protein
MKSASKQAAEIKKRIRLREALVYAVRQHPEGITSAYAAEAVGCNRGVAMRQLTELAKDGVIGRKFLYKKGTHSRFSLWLPDPGRGIEPNPTLLSYQKRGPVGFVPYQNFDESHDVWMKKMLEEKPKFNPFGRG